MRWKTVWDVEVRRKWKKHNRMREPEADSNVWLHTNCNLAALDGDNLR